MPVGEDIPLVRRKRRHFGKLASRHEIDGVGPLTRLYERAVLAQVKGQLHLGHGELRRQRTQAGQLAYVERGGVGHEFASLVIPAGERGGRICRRDRHGHSPLAGRDGLRLRAAERAALEGIAAQDQRPAVFRGLGQRLAGSARRRPVGPSGADRIVRNVLVGILRNVGVQGLELRIQRQPRRRPLRTESKVRDPAVRRVIHRRLEGRAVEGDVGGIAELLRLGRRHEHGATRLRRNVGRKRNPVVVVVGDGVLDIGRPS